MPPSHYSIPTSPFHTDHAKALRNRAGRQENRGHNATRHRYRERFVWQMFSTGVAHQGVITQQPDVSSIQKDRSMKIFINAETIFDVCFQTNITSLIKIRKFTLFRMIATGTDTTYRKGADTIGTTDIKLLAIRSNM